MRFIIAVILCFALSSPCWANSQAGNVRLGNKLFKDGDYERAIKKYSQALDKEPDSDIINFNIGTAFYKKNEYEKAIQHLNKSLLTEDDGLKSTSYYNLGNALYKAGIAKEGVDLNAAIHSLERSLSHYKKALHINSDDEDTKYNHEFVQKELERLKKKQQKEKKQQSRQGQKKQGQPQSQEGESQKKQENKSIDQGNRPQASQQKEGEKKDKSQEEAGQERKLGKETNGQQQREPKQSSASSMQQKGSIDEQAMTPKEAQMLLDQYQQGEEPKGFLNALMGQRKFHEVEKDW